MRDVFLLIVCAFASQASAQSLLYNPIMCPDGRAISRSDYAGLYGIDDADGENIIPFLYVALSCFQDGISWVAIEEEGHWCPFGEDGARLDSPKCQIVYNPFPMSDMVQMPMSNDLFWSSALWMKQWLRHAEFLTEPAPLWVSASSIVIFGYQIEQIPFQPSASDEWPVNPNWP